MRAIGIRELKNRLSEYVRLVAAGESVLVTDHGRVVAEIRPPGPTTQPADVPSELAALAAEGRLTLGAPHDPELYLPRSRILPEGVLEQLLDVERGDG